MSALMLNLGFLPGLLADVSVSALGASIVFAAVLAAGFFLGPSGDFAGTTLPLTFSGRDASGTQEVGTIAAGSRSAASARAAAAAGGGEPGAATR